MDVILENNTIQVSTEQNILDLITETNTIEVKAGEDARTIIDDNTVSLTEVWSSSKTNEELNKLLPLIYAGL